MADTKSNAEGAQSLAGGIILIGEDNTANAISKAIESALSTAQSNLAREVLAELENYYDKPPCPDADDLVTRLRALFTRLNVKID